MNAFLDLMLHLINGLYSPLITAFDEIPMLSIQIVFGTGYITLGQLLATIIVLTIYFGLAYFPTYFIYKAFKRLMSVMF